MREVLQPHEEERATFRGTFERFGEKSGWKRPERTILLKDILNADGKKVADHLWFNYTKGFAALDLQPGDLVEFRARVKRYWKGYMGRRWDVYKPVEEDYKLSHPTQIVKVQP